MKANVVILGGGISAEREVSLISANAVQEALQTRGNASLPLVLVDDRVAVEGAYPTRETLAALAGVVVRKLEVASVSAACCAPASVGASAGKKTSCC